MAYDTKYSSNESLDRILRLLKGETVNEAPDSLVPPLHSWDESLSNIAELLAGTLEGEQVVVPTGMDSYGVIYAYNGTTGSVLTSSGTWTVVEQWRSDGEARNATIDYSTPTVGYSITPDYEGDYMMGYNLSVAGTTGANVDLAIYSGGAVQVTTKAKLNFLATGTIHNVSALGMTNMAVGNKAQLIVLTDVVNTNFTIIHGQMWLKRL